MALISVLTSAVILTAFAGAAWWKLREARMAALDQEIEDAGHLLAQSARWNPPATAVETRLGERFGKDRAAGWIYAVTRNGEEPQRSAQWPKAIDPHKYPPGTELITRDMPPGGFEDRDRPPRREGGGPRGDFGRGPPPDEFFDDAPPRRDGPRERGPGGPREGFGRPQLFKPVFSTVQADGRTWRLGVFGNARSGITIHLGLDVDVFAADLAATARAFGLALPGALLLVAAGAWFAARRGLAPVKQLSEKIETLDPGNANERLDPNSADTEFNGIIGAYNAMLDRLERSYRQATRFSADASHELKTPLAVMRATVEKGLRECPDGSAEQRTFSGLLDEIDQLQAIIESLLLLSRADAGRLATNRETLDFSAWMQPLVEDAGLMAEEHHLTLHTSLTPGLTIHADPVLLYRCIHNLLRNAVAYNIDGGEIDCRLTESAGRAILTISNTGETVPEGERERIFERFMRGANAGGTGGGKGLGVGLSLAREIATAHGGSLVLADKDRGRTTMILSLPLAAGSVSATAGV
ncbi:MAG TPA: ATP-binding protein [Verrucomicrobiales bacterium]|nr:ATP-binding protein [Verrucomicrobiales bacterium]